MVDAGIPFEFIDHVALQLAVAFQLVSILGSLESRCFAGSVRVEGRDRETPAALVLPRVAREGMRNVPERKSTSNGALRP